MTPGAARSRGALTVPALLLRALLVAGLVVDAVIHLRLAGGYQLAAPSGIGEGTLFRIQAVLALVLALAVLVRANKLWLSAAFLVAAAALGAVLLYRYVDVPAVGPIPAMYEPVWFAQKALSAVAEAVAALAALALLGLLHHRSRERPSSEPTAPHTATHRDHQPKGVRR